MQGCKEMGWLGACFLFLCVLQGDSTLLPFPWDVQEVKAWHLMMWVTLILILYQRYTLCRGTLHC